MSLALGVHMEREIRHQLELLPGALASYRQFVETLDLKPDYSLVVAAARGSSDNAALYLRYLIESLAGIPVSLAAPSVLTLFKGCVRYSNALGVGISQSGAAADVAAVLEAMKEQDCDTLAITNTPDSRLARTASNCLLLGMGIEQSVAATKTYVASLLAAAALTERLARVQLDIVLPDASETEALSKAAENDVSAVLSADVVVCLGRGYAYASALECTLKLMECALIPCKCYSTADFEHGPKALLDPKTVLICFSEPPASAVQSGCTIIGPTSTSPTDVSGPLSAAIYSQWLALLCARVKDIDPDTARNLSKVTVTT